MEQSTPASQLPDESLVGALLMRTSRTFALNIPLLPEQLRQQVGIAYLLFRIADTVEDGVLVDRRTKRRLFHEFKSALESGDPQDAKQFCGSADATAPHDDPACAGLIQELPRLLSMLGTNPDASSIIRRRVLESSDGMQRFTSAGGPSGNVRLKSLLELRQYCYFVAGIVGELLTELFVLNEPQLADVRSELMQFAPLFGEGLQLVNILKDSGDDASEGRQFVHPIVPREHLFDLAHSDLWYAAEYTRVLEQANASAGIVQFTQLPVRLATATLGCVQEHGPGTKVSREVVGEIIASVLAEDSQAEPRTGSDTTNLKVLLAAPRGFCAGVEMAIKVLDIAIDRLGTPIYVYHEIVHNRHVVENFTARGAVFVDSIAEVPHGSNLIFSAHGVSPEVRAAAKARELFTIDATCPLVAKVHVEAARFAKLGYQIILIGHEGHDEVVGTVGEAPGSIRIVQSEADIAALEFPTDTPVAWLTQTTLSVSDTAKLVALLEQKFPKIIGPPKDDICYATQNRQAAIQALCDEADAVIVVGSQNSSNSQRLKELAIEHDVKAWLIDGADELVRSDFADYQTIAITAGASAPESAVEDVMNWLGSHFNVDVEVRTHTREDRVFSLPVELEINAGKGRTS